MDAGGLDDRRTGDFPEHTPCCTCAATATHLAPYSFTDGRLYFAVPSLTFLGTYTILGMYLFSATSDHLVHLGRRTMTDWTLVETDPPATRYLAPLVATTTHSDSLHYCLPGPAMFWCRRPTDRPALLEFLHEPCMHIYIRVCSTYAIVYISTCMHASLDRVKYRNACSLPTPDEYFSPS